MLNFNMISQKIIIDTDPGVDDALAIMLALSSRLVNVLGICTVYGNSSIENTTKNALSLIQIINQNIPIFQGVSKPIYGNFKPANSHGQNGLGNFELKELTKCIETESAIGFYIKTLDFYPPKSVTIVAIGPSTNLAILKILRPDLFTKIKELIIMAGVFEEEGNTTKYAEFNCYCDPYSFYEILKSEVKNLI